MMLNEDTLADEFDAILNYRVTHAGLVLAGEAYAHTPVRFASDYLYSDTATGFGSIGYLTIAFKVRFSTSTAASQNIFVLNDSINGQTLIVRRTASSGNLTVIFKDADVPSGLAITTIPAAFETSGWTTSYTVHIAISKDGASALKVWVNEASVFDNVWPGGFSVESLNFSAADIVRIGASSANGNLLNNADMSFIYVKMGNTSASYLTDTTLFYDSGDVDLGADGTLSGAPAPEFFYTGEAAAWNSGVNLGTSIDLTMSGTVDPVP